MTAVLHISCGCVWDGDVRIVACPAHKRPRGRRWTSAANRRAA